MDKRRFQELRRLFGARVKMLREERGWTQAELAERCDLSLDMIGRLERGTAAPSFETMGQLAEIFEVQPATLLGGTSFLNEPPQSKRSRHLARILTQLLPLDSKELEWIEGLILAARRSNKS